MKKINKILINSISALTVSAAIIAPLCVLTNKTVTANKNANETKLSSTLNASYTTVKFTAGDYEGECTITGTTLVKGKVGMPFCSVSKPKILHNDSWKFIGWSTDGSNVIDENTAIPAEGLTLTPLFEEPIDITNCMGVSAIEKTTVTVNLQSTDTPDLSVSYDYGKNWITITETPYTYEMSAGSTIYFKGQNDGSKEGKTLAGFSTSSDNYTHFSFSDNVNIFGNVLALIYNGAETTKKSVVPNDYCFYHLFEGCTTIKNISDNFLMSEYNDDNSVLKANCYEGMFKGCTNISHAPRLYATNENVKNAQGCYKEIFYNCSKVDAIRTRFTEDFTSSDYSACWENWVYGVASSGSIVYDGTCTTKSSSAIPTGWTISSTPDAVEITTTQTAFLADHEYTIEGICKKDGTELPNESVLWTSDNPDIAVIDQATGTLKGIPFDTSSGTTSKTATLHAYAKTNLNATAEITVTINAFDSTALANCTKITAAEDSAFHWTYVGEGIGEQRTIPTFRYSTDGITWKDMVRDEDISLESGDSIYIKGNNTSGLARGDDETSYTNFVTTSGSIKVAGDIKGLIYDGRGSDEITDAKIPCNYCFKSLFEGCGVTEVSDGFLSFTNFDSKINVYHSMFEECTSLTKAPALPAVTLTEYCYFRMFFNCSALKAVPTLSDGEAPTLANSCYKRMFYGCSSITATPALPATTAQPYCYYMMFQGCSGLTSIGKIGFTKPAEYSCFQMFSGISQSLWNKIKTSSSSLSDYICYFSSISATGCVTRMIAYYTGSGSVKLLEIKKQTYYYIS